MTKRFEAFCDYYRLFFEDLFSQVWKSWRAEVWSAVIIAVLVFAVSYGHDPNAESAFFYTAKACLIYLFLWLLYHLIRTPWQLSLRPPRTISKRRTKQPVDLQGELLEIYIRYPDEFFFPVTRAFIYINARIVNCGVNSTAITEFGLLLELGDYLKGGTLITIPDNLRIKRQRDGSFIGTAFEETRLDPPLAASPNVLTYESGIPHEGWLAFEVYIHGSDEISNVKFDLLLRDSFGGVHSIIRNPGVYRKTGQLVG